VAIVCLLPLYPVPGQHPRIRRDPMDLMIENAFQPGHFISYYDDYSFVEDLRRLETEIAKLARSNPARRHAV
jgi:hypothetical protein